MNSTWQRGGHSLRRCVEGRAAEPCPCPVGEGPACAPEAVDLAVYAQLAGRGGGTTLVTNGLLVPGATIPARIAAAQAEYPAVRGFHVSIGRRHGRHARLDARPRDVPPQPCGAIERLPVGGRPNHRPAHGPAPRQRTRGFWRAADLAERPRCQVWTVFPVAATRPGAKTYPVTASWTSRALAAKSSTRSGTWTGQVTRSRLA